MKSKFSFLSKHKLLSLFVILFLLVIIFKGIGWRFFGFFVCSSPEELICTNVYVTDTSVVILGYGRELEEPNAKISFSGYKYKIVDDTMYIGLKPDYFSGLKPTFEINISDKEISKIDNIYFTNENHENDILVWNRMDNGVYFERFENIILLQDEIDVSFLWDNSQSVREGKTADQKFVDMIRNPIGIEVNPDATQWTIDDYYLCVAEKSSGMRECLKIKNDNSCFVEYGRPQIVYYLHNTD